jgi:Carboxypeptidase regulatory-like domain/TonB dependent receptor/TonB-dependent Receptor Plug Domain
LDSIFQGYVVWVGGYCGQDAAKFRRGCTVAGALPSNHCLGPRRIGRHHWPISGPSRATARLWILFSLLFILVAPRLLLAQASGGSITGTVTSASGAALPGAQISITNVETGAITRTVTSDTQGFYIAPDLAPGSYDMRALSPGFVTQVWTTIGIAAGSVRVLNLTMLAGSPETVVRNVAPAAPISQNSSCCGGNVNSSGVRNTPLNGRDWTQLATLQAGVTGVQTGSAQGGGNTERGFGAAMSISGARPDQNNFRVDGISINDYANGAPGSVLGDSLGIDAVEEVSVLGSNYPAEYGRTTGGIVNAATKSGSNSFHGSVYEFLRNSALDARNFFDGPTIPPFKHNQFGASAGLPIQKGKTFLFADYEDLRQSLGITTVDTTPSPAARAGNLCSLPSGVSPACTPNSVPVDPSVVSFLKAFYPLPNGALLGNGDTGIFTFAGQQVTDENYVTARIDRKLTQEDTISGTYMRDASKVVQPDAFDSLLSNIVSTHQLVTLHEQHIFSATFLNAARFGFNRAIGIDGGVTKILNPLVEDPSYGFIPGQFPGQIASVPGITSMPDTPIAGNPGTLEASKSLHWNSFQAGDDIFLTRGINALRFGAVVERIQDNAISFFTSNGAFRFNTLSDLLTNRPREFSGLVPSPQTTYGTRQTLFGTYFEDDVRVRQNLTVNLGLRYEIASVPTEVHNDLSNLQNVTDAQPHLGSPYFLNSTLHNLEPRLGFAWTPSKNSRTLLRGGFGMFDVLPLPYELRDITPNPFPFARQFLGEPPQGSFPTGAYTLLSTSPTGLRANYVEHSPKRSYVMQWNLSAAEQISSTWVVTVGYVGSRGVHLPFRLDNINMVLPTLTPAGYLFPPVSTSQKLNPNFGRVTAMLWQANSFYDALQVDLTKKVTHGIEFHVAYTWGKSIDTLSATVADDSYPNGMFNPLFFDQRTSRGLSDFNVAQDLVVSYTWELPSPQFHSKAAAWALGGWQLGGLYKASSGQPFTPLLGGDPEGTKLDETSEPPNLMAGPGCSSLVNPGNPNRYIRTQCLAFPNPASLRGNLGRNKLIGPGISKFDFSVFKNNRVRKISEDFNAQFRAEFFNIFNRANFASPTDNLNVFDASGSPVDSAGLITSTQTSSRQIQLALKFIW